MQAANEVVNIFQCPVWWMDGTVVRNIITYIYPLGAIYKLLVCHLLTLL